MFVGSYSSSPTYQAPLLWIQLPVWVRETKIPSAFKIKLKSIQFDKASFKFPWCTDNLSLSLEVWFCWRFLADKSVCSLRELLVFYKYCTALTLHVKCLEILYVIYKYNWIESIYQFKLGHNRREDISFTVCFCATWNKNKTKNRGKVPVSKGFLCDHIERAASKVIVFCQGFFLNPGWLLDKALEAGHHFQVLAVNPTGGMSLRVYITNVMSIQLLWLYLGKSLISDTINWNSNNITMVLSLKIPFDSSWSMAALPDLW